MFETFKKRIRKKLTLILVTITIIMLLIFLLGYGKNLYVYVNDVFCYMDGEGLVTKTETLYMKWFMIIYFSFLTIVWIVSILYASSWKKRIYKYMSQNNVSELQLESEFAKAEEVIPNFWISQQYTFYFNDLNITIIRNEAVEQIYLLKYIGSGVSYRIVLTTIGKKRYKVSIPLEDRARKILQYYEKSFPNIKIGDEEIRFK